MIRVYVQFSLYTEMFITDWWTLKSCSKFDHHSNKNYLIYYITHFYLFIVSFKSVFIIFRSSARDNALSLCDWGSDRNNSSHISNVLRKLENENAHSRAASIAIFNLRIRDAIETLNKGASQQNNLSMIAMALSGNNIHIYIYMNSVIFYT